MPDVTCPKCGETDDIKDGAALPPGNPENTYDYGCRSCKTVFNEGDV